MKRTDFLKKSLMGLTAAIGLPAIAKAEKSERRSTYDKLMDEVGFNHLPNDEVRTAHSVLHKAHTRGHANHGWLDTYHTFSFANYRNPERMNFGVLRVLNDDKVAGGRGFRTHPHDNMEIISIPLEGALQHKDTLGNTHVIQKGDVQVMSAGTGIYHSEFNNDRDQDVRFLQIWLFPRQRSVQPRYDQLTFDPKDLKNNLQQILSPHTDDAGVWIHQDAWFHLGEMDKGFSTTYSLKKPGNGVYAFVIDGDVTIDQQPLNRRDGYGVWNTSRIRIQADSKAKLLLMEVPMRLG